MNDFSFLLGKDVGGKHKNRGGALDESEMRAILSDWFSTKAHDLDGQSALQELISVLKDGTINLLPLAKDLEQHLPVKRIVLLGPSGSGKSTLGNFILGKRQQNGFRVSPEMESCTKKAEEKKGRWMGRK